MGWITISPSADPAFDAALQSWLDEGKTQADLDLEAKLGRSNPSADADWDAKYGELNK